MSNTIGPGKARQLDALWCCPRCRSALVSSKCSLRCDGCWAAYELIGNIPDLRVPTAAWIDFDRDTADAKRLRAAAASRPLDALVREVFAARPRWSDARVYHRTQQVLGGPDRSRRELDDWLAPIARARGTVLEIGCGTGGLLAALPKDQRAIGIDVSLVWLVVAERLLEQHGRRPTLAAAVGEALPLGAASVGAIVALDVLEHVGDLPQVLREMDRVAAAGCALACSTPNRFSLAAEPHVGVWGVGWLPRSHQPSYVRWRSGEDYAFVRLLSAHELAGLAAQHTRFVVSVKVPPVPEEELANMPPRRARLARLYNRIQSWRWLRPLLLVFGPFFRVVGTTVR
jgi:SAM-dependent methyltransferase